MLNAFFKSQPRKLMENEIRESEILILQAHTNKEHWDAQIAYHNAKLKRLRASWVAMQKDEKDSPKGKDKIE